MLWYSRTCRKFSCAWAMPSAQLLYCFKNFLTMWHVDKIVDFWTAPCTSVLTSISSSAFQRILEWELLQTLWLILLSITQSAFSRPFLPPSPVVYICRSFRSVWLLQFYIDISWNWYVDEVGCGLTFVFVHQCNVWSIVLDGFMGGNGVVVIQTELSVLKDSFGMVFLVGHINILQSTSLSEFNMNLFSHIIMHLCIICGSKKLAPAGNMIDGLWAHSALSTYVGPSARVFYYVLHIVAGTNYLVLKG